MLEYRLEYNDDWDRIHMLEDIDFLNNFDSIISRIFHGKVVARMDDCFRSYCIFSFNYDKI